LSGLFDFFQSASNTVADNVAGPVDLINAGLGLFGLRSKEPVGGSEWMKRWGLKRDVEMGGARLAGETAGLLSPTLLAAKAPQIAKGLLQAQENAAIPRQMNPEMGAIVYHGSPHKFDKFDSSKIGTGEGAQAYGHGLYLAENPATAQSYQASTTRGFGLPDGPTQGVANVIAMRGEETARKVYADLGPDLEPTIKAAKEAIANNSSLYKVDLPDTAIAKMLDWDKPLSQQAPEVKKALSSLGEEDIPGQLAYYRLAGQLTGKKALQSPEASDALRKAGIPGIRYLDGGSRGAGTGTSNYVVFPGEEGLLKILERNGGLMGP
jgi:hypothetical protein